MAGRRFALGRPAILAVPLLRAVPAAANPPSTFNPVVEAENFSITRQRQTIYDARVQVYVGKRLVLTRRGRSLRSIRLAGLPGNGKHKLRLLEYTRSGRARAAKRTVYGCAS